MNMIKHALTISSALAIVVLSLFACSEDDGSIDTRCFDLAFEYSDMVCACEDWIDFCACVAEGGFYDFIPEEHVCIDDCEGVSEELVNDCECYMMGMTWIEDDEQCEVYYLSCTDELIAEFQDLIDNFVCPEAAWSEEAP
ncbi:hypothetical protein ACFL4G_11590 [Thermodesulfobacteriota bacterium]